MVVPSSISSSPSPNERVIRAEIPIIDLSKKRSQVRELIVKASEEYGFFKVINHGVAKQTIEKIEREGFDFFAKSASEKHKAGPPNPLGYGIKNIGFSGDKGEVEYLILHTNPQSISQRSKSISKDPSKFRVCGSCAVNEYVHAVRNLACEILDLMAEGLWAHDKTVFSRLIRDVDSDSLIRLNHYPSFNDTNLDDWDPSLPYHHHHHHMKRKSRIGFGEHSDPQILTLLRSNDVEGLQISLENGMWVSVPPDSSAFCVNIGDVLQAMTNGRFISARHRVMANSAKARMSMMYFGAPPLHAWIAPLQELITRENPPLYRAFTWCEYKKATYSLRLGDGRLDLFRVHDHHHHEHTIVAA
ncbi:hypothetical protein Sjap_007235 [Stephania japonica]|uniref:gibberellin 2beta-dioxygenase n=1 Tax=Stephania japonica TaxID=461633 RepID=A0AAP0JM76_9MAGN